MLSLVVDGDSIYLLPYMRKSFQTSMQEVFDVTFMQLGVMNAIFGVLAITGYPAGRRRPRFTRSRPISSYCLKYDGLRTCC